MLRGVFINSNMYSFQPQCWQGQIFARHFSWMLISPQKELVLYCFRRMEGKNVLLHTLASDCLRCNEDSILWKANPMP